MSYERLCVFAKGWTLEAGEVVCAGDSMPSEHVLNALLQLNSQITGFEN